MHVLYHFSSLNDERDETDTSLCCVLQLSNPCVCLQVDPVSDWRLFCDAHAHGSVVERLGHTAQLEVSRFLIPGQSHPGQK